ncbi:hypothetical protein [Clostridium kluyveri]|uniref:CPBP family intramembrane metalloprotease n=1 Tax=Clostridium kluyveri TaxID=1534 RepID=A0A1L5F5M9_CLOKL|nr:hypothetical protein [Clostridium kluyveri]APM38309.1 hypothetical protein BS101_05920 [Clostridium kluyveri]
MYKGTDEYNVTYNFSIVLSNIILYLVIISPVLLTKKFLKQSWTSTGISKRNLKKSVIVGIIAGIIYIILSLIYMDINIIIVIARLNISYFWGLVYFSTVGFCEEFIFRGYFILYMIG